MQSAAGTAALASSAFGKEIHEGKAEFEPPRAGGNRGYKRIATEEAWAPPSLIQSYLKMATDKSINDPGFVAMWSRLGARKDLIQRLTNIDTLRLSDMDATGIDVQILSLTSPGVQVFDRDTANGVATLTNDAALKAAKAHN